MLPAPRSSGLAWLDEENTIRRIWFAFLCSDTCCVSKLQFFQCILFCRFKASNISIHEKAIFDASCIACQVVLIHCFICFLLVYKPVEIIFKRGHSKPHFSHIYFKIHHAANETDCFILHGIAIQFTIVYNSSQVLQYIITTIFPIMTFSFEVGN